MRDEAGSVEVIAPATLSSATAKGSGNVLPRFSARRRMPRAARADSQYFAGALGSNTSARLDSDDEHPPSSLRHSEETAVENPPSQAVPELGQRGKHDSEVPTAVRGEQSGYVLEENGSGSKSLCDSGELEEEAASLACESRPASGDGEVLAGEASAEKIASAGSTEP